MVLGSLAIAIVLPNNQISLVSGIMQAFTAFFSAYHLHWIIPVVGILLIIGGIGGINNWTIAPLKGLLVAAQDNALPKLWQKENRYYAPVALLIGQGIFVSLLASLFLLLPTINESYWLLTTLASQLYMLMYIFMFAAGICLRFKYPQQYRPYKIPGGNWGMIITGVMGIIACIGTILIGFFPPQVLSISNVFDYEILIISGLIAMILIPIFIGWQRRS